jgi:uncharacterized membrane protein YbhN (UPF0104 family)
MIPVVLGVGVMAFFFYQQGIDLEAYRAIEWTWWATFWMVLGVLMIVIRQVAYMYRIRVLTGNQLTWKQSFDVILLWEFASAATPSIVGGAAAALFLLNKEKVNMGRSTAIVMFTAFLDELFFIVFAPIVFFLAGKRYMFPDDPGCLQDMNIGFLQTLDDLIYIFIGGYLLLFFYTALIAYGLFINPVGLKRMIVRTFSLPFLRRWRLQAWQTGVDLIVASRELQKQGFGYWAKSFGATIVSWSARYLVVNCIILAFAAIDNNFIVFARQFVIWVIMLVPTTPGASGIAEITFISVLCEFIPSKLSNELTLLWRIFSYYPYLFLGAIVMPRWLRRVYSSKD